MPLRMVLIGLGFLAVFGLAGNYVWRRLVKPSGLSGWRRRVASWGLMGFVFSGPLVMFVGRWLPPSGLVSPLRFLGFVLMGAGAMLMTMLLIRDLGFLSYHFFRWVKGKVSGEVAPIDPSRRQLLFNISAAGVATAATAATTAGFYSARHSLRLVRQEVHIDGLSPALDGFRIAHISDIHVGPTVDGEDLSKMVEALNALDADMIAITGDLVDGFVDDLAPEVASLAELKAAHGVYYCLGNHEYFWDGPAWSAHISSMGIASLDNRHVVVEHKGAKLLIGGVTDYRGGAMVEGHESSPASAIEGAPDVDLKLLLAHQPRSATEAAAVGFDVQLSGHTHGGQFFPINLIIPFIEPYTRGLYEVSEMKLFVSAGAGYWGPPMRLGVPPEYHLITLRGRDPKS